MPRGGKRPGAGRKPGGMLRLQAWYPREAAGKARTLGRTASQYRGATTGYGRPAGRLNDPTVEALAIARAGQPIYSKGPQARFHP